MIKNIIKLSMIFILITVFFTGSAFAQNVDERSKLLTEATNPFFKGEYEDAIKIFDDILETYPNDYKILELKGLARD